MNISESLGMPAVSTEDTNQTPLPPEDSMLLPIGFLFTEGGVWWITYLTRADLKPLLSSIGTGGAPIFDNRQVVAIRLAEIEGPECNMQFIYDFIAQTWRLE